MDSINSFILLVFDLPLRLGAISLDYDPTQLSLTKYKLWQGVVDILIFLSRSSTCFIHIDHYLSTNYRVYLHQRRTLKLVHRLIFTTILVVIIYYIPHMIFFGMKPHFCFYPVARPITVSMVLVAFAYKNIRRVVRRQTTIR